MTSFSNATSQIHSTLSEQISLLDLLFPGFTSLSSSIWPLLTGAPSLYGRLLCICGLLVLIGKYGPEYFENLLQAHFTSKMEVPYNDEAYDMLISWVCSQPFAQSVRASLAKVALESSGRGNRSGSQAYTGDGTKKPLHYSPWNGRFYFWHRRHLFFFERSQTRGQFGFSREEASISYFGRNPNVLRELLDECRRHYLALVKNNTCVFKHQGEEWTRSKLRSKRDMSTVVLNNELKEMLVGDISDFLNPTTRKWYSTRSIPYKRGYLFHGPPGTGKSSFSFSLAGQFDLDLYILNIPTLDNHSLKALFEELPQHCVVLLEDIDAVGSKRTGNSNKGVGQSTSSTQMPALKRLSLSTLLNVLDGIGSAEGRVLIMTTNYIGHLDPALIRPGRVDTKVEFPLADEDMISQLFFFIYDPQSINVTGGDESENGVCGTKEEKAVKDCDLPQLAQEFVTKVPKLEFSPAEVMSLLLANKQSPRHAIVSVDTWIERIREERKKLTRTNSWALDDNDGF
ncbi:putative mitochondrial chaperone bcs1 [Zopfia rhizophila CBS 207.26]|uniref:Putative mitochondrial chaperone bcs1 n=1 Tax=Zopfia rhizophila CBS 207.26 TaxID=1314779 RepID=A0A6A6ES78_9PEZI|nr:putative mitochondrial chaperone bcs1 [Zopfia rhizophila CBS 207.26]